MAALVGALRVVLGANTAQYESGMRRAGRTARTTGQSITQSLQGAQRIAVNAFRGIAAAAGVVGAGAAARQFLRYADSSKQLEAQLRLATRESGNFARAQDDVRRIARETRSGLEETATLYGTFQRNSRELGITQLEAARATETLSKTFSISGATASEASNATRQFIQGLQAGALRGDEFNSVMEQAPRLQRLLAQALDVPIGRLRALAEEGQITAAHLTRALTDQRFTAGIDAEFRELPVTFDQAMTLVNNAAIETFGAFDRGGQFSEAIVNFITGGVDGMDDLANAAERAGIDMRATFAGLADAFQPMLEGALSAFDSIGVRAVTLRDQISALLGAFDSAVNAFDQAAAGAREGSVFGLSSFVPGSRGLIDPYIPPATPIGSDARGRFERGYSESQRRGEAGARARALGGDARNGRSVGPQEFQRFINEPGRYDIWGNPLDRRPPRPTPPASSDSNKRRGESAETRRRRQLREDERFDQELRQLQQDLISARQATVAAAEAVAAFDIQEIEAARDRTNAGYQADAEQARDRRDLARARAQQLIEANNVVAAERINAVRLREQERIRQEQVEVAAADLENSLDLEQAQGGLAETTRARRESALRLLESQEQLERLELENIRASRDASAAQKEIARRRLEILDTLYQAREQDVLDSTRGPLSDFVNDLPTTAEKLNEALENVAANGLRSIEDGLVSIIDGTKSVADSFSDMAKSIISDLIRIAIQRAIIAPLANALFPGGAVPGFATGGSIIVGGVPGVDRNMLSLNGAPVARVSRGETVGVGWGGASGGKVEIILRDAMLDARIAEGAGVTITRAYPAMKADMQASQAQGQRRR